MCRAEEALRKLSGHKSQIPKIAVTLRMYEVTVWAQLKVDAAGLLANRSNTQGCSEDCGEFLTAKKSHSPYFLLLRPNMSPSSLAAYTCNCYQSSHLPLGSLVIQSHQTLLAYSPTPFLSPAPKSTNESVPAYRVLSPATICSL